MQSPLKMPPVGATPPKEKGKKVNNTSRKLDLKEDNQNQLPRKRKSKGHGSDSHTPDLNLPVVEPNAIVPIGLVHARVNQMDSSSESAGDSMIETLKKQKRVTPQNARSAAAASDSPHRAQ